MTLSLSAKDFESLFYGVLKDFSENFLESLGVRHTIPICLLL